MGPFRGLRSPPLADGLHPSPERDLASGSPHAPAADRRDGEGIPRQGAVPAPADGRAASADRPTRSDRRKGRLPRVSLRRSLWPLVRRRGLGPRPAFRIKSQWDSRACRSRLPHRRSFSSDLDAVRNWIQAPSSRWSSGLVVVTLIGC